MPHFGKQYACDSACGDGYFIDLVHDKVALESSWLTSAIRWTKGFSFSAAIARASAASKYRERSCLLSQIFGSWLSGSPAGLHFSIQRTAFFSETDQPLTGIVRCRLRADQTTLNYQRNSLRSGGFASVDVVFCLLPFWIYRLPFIGLIDSLLPKITDCRRALQSRVFALTMFIIK